MKILINNCHGGYGFSEEFEEFFGMKSWEITELPRHDPKLIQAVENFGIEKASGWAADLLIEEIEGNKYRIKEYDGLEFVETPETIDWEIVE
jgi:hypothetical protein